MNALTQIRLSPDEAAANAAVISKAVVRAALQLDIRQVELAAMLGISPASVSRLMAGEHVLAASSKPYELAVLVIRLFRSLSGIFGSDSVSTKAWLRCENTALGGVPASLMASATGLVNAVAYTDAARARI